MPINRIHAVKNKVTKEIKYFGSRPQACRFLLEQKEKGSKRSAVDECDFWELSQVLEYEYKYQLVVLINDIFKNGYEGGMEHLTDGEMTEIIKGAHSIDELSCNSVRSI